MIMKCLLVFILFATACRCNDSPLVTTPLGKVRGFLGTSFKGKRYAAFEGIPFAKPPIGERRFEDPEPVEAWSGIWEANFTSGCAQTTILNYTFVEQPSEDCLYLNVYVPQAKPHPEDKLDVLVHIHGGAFMYGSGHVFVSPTFIMDQDVIFVTFNYRLGILGFLSTEDDVVPGNAGLKDQVLALEWVQKNIASFGGNPESVTLTGLSAGGASVHFHYFSEMSKGLFHRGFSQSGCALLPWAIQEEPLKKAKILAEAVGCPTSPTRVLVQCLKQRPYKHLLAKMELFFGYSFLPLAPFAPVVEKGGSKPFLEEDPYLLLIQRKVYDVPWITSNTAHEGFMIMQEDLLKEAADKWEDLAPFLLDYNYTLQRASGENVAKTIKQYYLKDQTISENMLQTSQIFSDRLFLVGTETALKEQTKVTKSPIYYYYFAYPGDTESKIVSHGGDAKYFYGDGMTHKPLTPNELEMNDVVMEMLVSFVKTGTPKISGVNWEPTGYDKLTYLSFDGPEHENIKLKTVDELTPRNFWKTLGLKENENLIVHKDEL